MGLVEDGRGLLLGLCADLVADLLRIGEALLGEGVTRGVLRLRLPGSVVDEPVCLGPGLGEESRGLTVGVVDSALCGGTPVRDRGLDLGEDLLSLGLGGLHQQGGLLGGVGHELLRLLRDLRQLLVGGLESSGCLGPVGLRVVVQAPGLALEGPAEAPRLAELLLCLGAQLVCHLLRSAEEMGCGGPGWSRGLANLVRGLPGFHGSE